MRNGFTYAGAAAAAATLVACATGEIPTPYWTIKESAFQQLEPGKTTEADVRRLIGIPETVNRFDRMGEDIWQYRYLEGGTYGIIAHVHFDLNGIYKYTYRIPDPVLNGEGIDQ